MFNSVFRPPPEESLCQIPREKKKKKSMALVVCSENKLSGRINYVCWGRVVLKNVLTFFVVLIFSTVRSYS